MNNFSIHDILLDNKYISNITIQEDATHSKINYKFVITCNLWANNREIPIVIGIPKNWQISLFDFYLKEYLYIPHVERNGKICLYNLDNAIIDCNFEGLLNQCIEKTKEIIESGENENNKDEFLKEFNAYFNLLNTKNASLSIPNIQKDQIIWYAQPKQNYYIIAEDTKFFLQREISATQQKGILFYIEPNNSIYPPCYKNFDKKDFINKLISNVNCQTFNSLYKKDKRELFLVFAIKQSPEIVNFCGFLLANPTFENKEVVSLLSFRECNLVTVNRIDKEYLTDRISFESSTVANKSFLIIGCGSIGGYIFHNLLKSGCTNVALIDNENFSYENICRHFLGNESVGIDKVIALEKYAKLAFPETKVISFSKKIEELLDENESLLTQYDYIISATASHTINKWLDTYLKQHEIKIPTFYAWNEPLNIGCHVALISHNNPCSYQDLFSRNERKTLYDISSYCESDQNFIKSRHGCSGSFIPYGPTLSIQTSILFMNLLKQHLEGVITDNVLLSEKNDDFYFSKLGFKVSERYKNQKNKVELIKLKDLINGVKQC